MKKICALFILSLVIYSVYKDITNGSTMITTPAIYSSYKTEPEQAFTLIKVQPGETVLSVFEKHASTNTKISFDQLKDDFIQLNDGIQPTDIKSGQIYKFPLYE